MLRVNLREVAHQCSEGARVRLPRLLAQGRDHLQRPLHTTRLEGLHSGEPLCITLDPARGVGRYAVLICAEPEQDQVHVVLSRACENSV